jgi:hypothetical protein
VNELNLSLKRRIAQEPDLIANPSNRASPTVYVDVDAKVRAAVCQAIRDEIPVAWIICATRNYQQDRLVPPSADCLGADPMRGDEQTALLKETGQASVQVGLLGDAGGAQLYDLAVALVLPDGITWDANAKWLKVARAVWWVEPADAQKATVGPPSVLSRILRTLRRWLFCSRSDHQRTEEVKTSTFILKVCQDCGTQVSFRNRASL